MSSPPWRGHRARPLPSLLQSMGQEKGESSGQIRACPCSTQSWESKQSLLAVHQESSGSARTRGWSAAALASSQRKEKKEKGIKERCLSQGCALGAGQPQLHHCWQLQQAKKMEQRGNQLLSTLGTTSPLTGDSPEPPRDTALQVPILGGLDPAAPAAPQEQDPGLDPWFRAQCSSCSCDRVTPTPSSTLQRAPYLTSLTSSKDTRAGMVSSLQCQRNTARQTQPPLSQLPADPS